MASRVEKSSDIEESEGPMIRLLPISGIDDSDRVRQDLGNLGALADSMARLGLLHPVVIRGDRRLLAGGRRLAAARRLGWETIAAHIYDSANAYTQARRIELEENETAKPWTPSEAVSIGRLVEEEEAAAARERMLAGKPSSESDKGRTDDAVARRFGWGKDRYREAKEVVESGEADLVEQMDATGKVHGAWRELRRRKADPALGAARGLRGTTDGPGAPVSHRTDYDSDEWYTPPDFLDAVREAMGGIDVDPASNADAQETVRAGVYFTKEDNGLKQEWHGRVFLNPPYSGELAKAFAAKLLEELDADRTTAAILIQNASTDTRWFHDLAVRGHLCFTLGRVGFLQPDGTRGANRYGQAVFYFGRDPDRFYAAFGRHGLVGQLRRGAAGEAVNDLAAHEGRAGR
jgi:ParB family chromosome partitioning protein